MTVFADMTARMFSNLLQACDEMIVGGGRTPAGEEILEIGSAVVRAGLPAPGEPAPLAAAIVLFATAAAMIFTRAGRSGAAGIPTEDCRQPVCFEVHANR